jgi:hypothetical protein
LDQEALVAQDHIITAVEEDAEVVTDIVINPTRTNPHVPEPHLPNPRAPKVHKPTMRTEMDPATKEGAEDVGHADLVAEAEADMDTGLVAHGEDGEIIMEDGAHLHIWPGEWEDLI